LPPFLAFFERLVLLSKESEKIVRGFLTLCISPTKLPQPIPEVNFTLLKLYVVTRYSLVNLPLPAKSSKPNAILGKNMLSGLYENFTLKPLSRSDPTLPAQIMSWGR